MAGVIGKIAYGVLFLVVLPAALVAWARGTSDVVALPVYGSFSIGFAIVIAGSALVLAGWHALFVHGGGLPMNAFPPSRLVSRGAYALTAHPIYLGFFLVCAGVSMATESPSGLWLVTPAIALGSWALLWGYELRDLDARFGAERPRSLTSLPPDEPRRPTLGERASLYLLLVVPWMLLYQGVTILGAPNDAIDTHFAFERSWPIVEWLYPPYASVYAVSFAMPLLLTSATDLRRFAVQGLISSGIVFPLFWFLPFVAIPRAFVPSTPFGELLLLERSLDSPGGALPSFHVVFAWLCASSFRRSRSLWFAWAAVVSVACVATGMHSILDVAFGLAVSALVIRYDRAWEWLRRQTETLANSWQEWRVGPWRVINHAAYAGLASGVGVAIVVCALGPRSAVAATVAATAGLVGAGAWAQWIEGSPKLLRPFGFYGGVLGIVTGSLFSRYFGVRTWELLAAFTLAGPVVQSLGRLRCLVQGCCHGSGAPTWLGIKYRHPRSRVVRLSPFAGQPVHATPLYSILGNVLVALVVARLWSLHVRAPFVAGAYLVMSGLFRFVEEAYRGETQTPTSGGLRLYQWIALAGVIAGAVIMTVKTDVVTPAPEPTMLAVWCALGVGALAAFALGVDLPASNKRFSRLV